MPWALSLACGALSCTSIDDPREREIVAVLTRADEAMLRSRPALVETKYRAMASSLYSFYRGTFPLYLHDASLGKAGGASGYAAEVYPMSLGDAHPENFGTLVAADGTLALEPNDLDAADRYPYLWELRRLAIGMVVAVRSSNAGDEAARAAARAAERDVAFAVAEGYAVEIARLADGGERGRSVDPGEDAFLVDLFERAAEDQVSREELQELTVVEGGERALKRGGIDPDDPENVFADAPDQVATVLPEVLRNCRATLVAPPEPEFFRIKDVVREYGSGIASRPRLRLDVLVEGPTASIDDDVILEIKEIGDSGAPPVGRPTVSGDDVAGRVLYAKRTAWSRRDADPLWGMSALAGLTVQVKTEREAHKTIRVARMVEELGTPDVLVGLGRSLGTLLARVHAGSDEDFPGTLDAIAAAIGRDTKGFSSEQAGVAVAYADVVEDDYDRFRDALRVLGPRLGVVADEADRPDADGEAIYGAPPPEGT
jgi:uncharacterized protein (DUF2252 family)